MAAKHLENAKHYRGAPPPGSPYSVALPGTAERERSAVYRHWRTTDGLVSTLDPAVRTAHDMFTQTSARLPRNKCLGHRPWDPVKKAWGAYVWQDYGTIAERRANLGAGLVQVMRDAGVTEAKFPVGLWCQNRPEWQLTDLACMAQGLYSVSLYDTLGPDSIEYIANHAELPVIATSLPHVATLLRIKARLPKLKVLVVLDAIDAGEAAGLSKQAVLEQFAADAGVKLFSLAQLEEMGKVLGGLTRMRPPVPEDLMTINYTSGTTGPPKGVVLTHAAGVAAIAASLCITETKPSDVGLSYLPLAHIYGRVIEGSALYTGSAIAYFHGNVLELLDDLKLVRPHGFYSVPRLYNRFGGSIKAATEDAPGVRGALSRHVVRTKMAQLAEPDAPGATNKHAFYDRIWGRKVAAAMGLDRARNMVSGSAPIDPSLHQFLRAVFGNNFMQGWGMTETYSVGLCQSPDDVSTGSCGGVMVATELCLQSVPDMEYFATDKPQPRGELLVRGPHMFSGYYKNDEETKASMLPGGWFRTGDICTVDARGRFRIIDRRKNVLKLAQGEYISPERIENVYLAHLNYLAQAFVHGDGTEAWLVAVFGISPDLFAPFASKVLHKRISAEDTAALLAACRDDRVRAAVMADLERVGKKNGFQGFEKVRACMLDLEPFSVENDLLTPTLKLKRPIAVKKFRKELDSLYAETKAGGKAKL